MASGEVPVAGWSDVWHGITRITLNGQGTSPGCQPRDARRHAILAVVAGPWRIPDCADGLPCPELFFTTSMATG
jgi:hypothetical protein